MGVNDYGAATSPLDAPPLGGPGGWAEAVAAVVDGDDTTVDARIAAATADLGARITRPNVDDRLVEQWNGSAWSVVGYDSGIRQMKDVTLNGWTATLLHLRRVNNTVVLYTNGGYMNGSAQTAKTFLAIPAGFRPRTTNATAAGWWDTTNPNNYGTGTPTAIWISNGSTFLQCAATSATINGALSWSTNDTTPTSLPGTLVTPAPE